MMDSILEVNNQNNRKGVKNKLKYFDSEALHLLNVYVRFCNRMQGQMSGGEESSVFLSRLVLQLKARLQLNYPSEKL
jgi:ABC-type hemin transport system ATPase subunit